MKNTHALNTVEAFTPVNPGEDREVTGIYCCDLLSLVMGRAQEGQVWVTVMGNQNAVAVASLADVACIVLAENMPPDEAFLQKAKAQDICVYKTDLPVYEAACAAAEALK